MLPEALCSDMLGGCDVTHIENTVVEKAELEGANQGIDVFLGVLFRVKCIDFNDQFQMSEPEMLLQGRKIASQDMLI